MSTTYDAVFSSWSWRPELAAVLLVWGAIYFHGWLRLRRRDPRRWRGVRLAAFVSGLGAIYLALTSPLETFASLLIVAHMVQHMLLMLVAPLLVLFGEPFLPLMRGLPLEVRRYWIAPMLRWRPLAWLASAVVHPLVAWILFVLAMWCWHLPGLYELALANDSWHIVQHGCFFAAGLIFWYPVVRPFPARPTWSRWILVPYLLLADVQNTLLAAWLTFSDQVLYPHYLQAPRLGGFSALDDQAAAGVTMWVPGSILFLAPLAWIGVGLMRSGQGKWGMRNREWGTVSGCRKPEVGGRKIGSEAGKVGGGAYALLPHSALHTPHFDLLTLPVVGAVLRSRWTRRLAQLAVLLIVLAVIVDGFSGPQVGAMNLAGVVPWIHWRGLVIFGLLILGNVFCFACPFTLPRAIARRLFGQSALRSWPRWLRNKWLAVGLMALVLWSYEAFSLWNSPWLTAWIAIFYFAGALVVDSLFRDAAFCKYVCPIGQFNFVQSLVSPFEVKVCSSSVCTTCSTHDCIRGNGRSNGCELQLFQPRKVGNLDCTFCLDCVQACPHENVGVIAVAPTASIWRDGPRSGIGRLSRRWDYTALAVVLVFGAFANAAGMVAPVLDWQDRLAAALGLDSSFWITTGFYLLCLFALPVLLVGGAALASEMVLERGSAIRSADSASRLNGGRRSMWQFANRFTWSLVPLGFAMWLAHYSFHFFTSCDGIVPVAQRFAADFHLASLGSPDWVCSCCRPAPDWLLKFELLALDIGMLASLYAVWRISLGQIESEMRTEGESSVTLSKVMRAAWPWALLIVGLFAVGVWILLQPMQMRGTMPGG